MAKVRVHELAKEIGRQNREVIAFLKSRGLDVKSHMSNLDESYIKMVKDNMLNTGKERTEDLDTPKTEEKAVTAANQEEKTAMPKKKKNIIRVYHAQNASDGGKRKRPAPGTPARKAPARQAKPAPAAQEKAPVRSAQPRPVQQEEKQKKRLEEKLSDNRYKEEIFDVFGCILRNSKRIQARKLFDYNIVLIGFMGAGKTTISDYLSTMFDMDIVEMDQVIAEREEMSISDIFATYGEEYFRDLETNLLIEMQSHKNAVISCGGGAALRERNVAEMKKNGRVVLLTATPETIYERVKDSNDRPVLNGRKNVKGISELMEQRREKYEAAADIVINTDDKTVLQICEELVQRLQESEE